MLKKTVLNNPVKHKTSYLFLVILLCVLANNFVIQNYIMTKEVYHNLYDKRLEAHRIDEMVSIFKKYSVWSYVIGPVLLLLRFTLVTLLIQLPLVVKFIDIRFSQLFRVVVIAFFPLLLMQISYTIWLLHLPIDTINEQTFAFVPLAVTNFINVSDYANHVYGFLGNFNVFEFAWCFLLALGLYNTGKLKKSDAVLIVICVWSLILVFQFVVIMYLHKVSIA
jgi:hypothetical protein